MRMLLSSNSVLVRYILASSSPLQSKRADRACCLSYSSPALRHPTEFSGEIQKGCIVISEVKLLLEQAGKKSDNA
jgi:hypothetical protein